MKFKKSITSKLFIITTTVFIIFILGTLIIQLLFFQKFYLVKKQDELQGNLNKFEQSYVKTTNSQDSMNLINDYENNYGYSVVILDNKGKLNFAANPSNQREQIFKFRFAYDVISQLQQNNILSVAKIKKTAVTTILSSMGIQRRSMVSTLYIPSKDEYVFFIDSLQPVSEAVGVIKEFYLYFIVGAVIVVIILSFIYSNMIAKPLVKINRIASKMAKLDFDEKCSVQSDDEIGSLSASLNFLSENLDNALTSLKEANSKLEKDIEKERRLERMRREFIAAVSHELKTPINLIEGYAEGMNDNIFEDEDREYYLDVIIDESKKMANLVADMLDLSQLESGNFKLIKEEFYLNELINTSVRKFSRLINEKNINLKINLIDNIKVFADWDRIEQVMTNYITNAIRHTQPEGSIEVKMIEDKENIRVEVFNTGNIIPEEEMVNIWDKFYKIDKSRNRSLGGTGIGLAIVKNILMLHNGGYGVENTEDGVRFYFVLQKVSCI